MGTRRRLPRKYGRKGRSAEQNTHSANGNAHSANGNGHSADRNAHSANGNARSADRNAHSADRNAHSADRNAHSADGNAQTTNVFACYLVITLPSEAGVVSILAEPASKAMIHTPGLYWCHGSDSWKPWEPGDAHCGSTTLQMSRDGHDEKWGAAKYTQQHEISQRLRHHGRSLFWQAFYSNYFGIGLNVTPLTSTVWVTVRIAIVESLALSLAASEP